MSDQQPLLSDFVPIATFAAELGVHTRTLKRWKTQSYGPTPVQIGKRIYYRRADIASWLASLGQSTKERGGRPRKRALSEPNRTKKELDVDQGVLNPAWTSSIRHVYELVEKNNGHDVHNVKNPRS